MRRLAALFALVLLVPFGIRALDARFGDAQLPDSYLPALEGPRARTPFDAFPREVMRRDRPDIVVIGDSMAGTRIDPVVLQQISGRRVYAILQAGSGPAFWYLALKNWVIASGARPRYVFIFFRDTNLTDVLFRMDEAFRWNVDRAALDGEREVNEAIAARAGAWRLQVTARTEALYRADRARLWMVPAIGHGVARLLEPSASERQARLARMNERLDFQHMRPVAAADIEDAVDREADFDYYLPRSVLPLMIRDAQAHGITLGFVRVQRRPEGNRPPRQSPALRAYVAALAEYVRSHGALWRDDTGDPALTLDMYGDGDHLAREARERYTSIFWNRLGPQLQ